MSPLPALSTPAAAVACKRSRTSDTNVPSVACSTAAVARHVALKLVPTSSSVAAREPALTSACSSGCCVCCRICCCQGCRARCGSSTASREKVTAS